MTALRPTPPAQLAAPRLAAALLAGGLMAATAACSGEASPDPTARPGSGSRTGAAWTEPEAYSYTLESSGGERALLGSYRVTVRDGRVTDARGLDDSARDMVKRLPDQVPTLGGLLRELERARQENADEAAAEFAADGHPVRISLDWDANAVDDEALYVISDYAPRT
ncbi:DUF6174 domain-containing protein [Streptomyces sp. NPDC052687]|uniref:DUF6174 domain-containing protein n=1 Tax=Streptomyces sp. NPDC052687 TaxID=3154759 RepID=UPI0034248B31